MVANLSLIFDGIKIFQGSHYLGCGNFVHNYLQLNCSLVNQDIFSNENNLNAIQNNTTIAGTKRTITRENSVNLWHRRLGHTSLKID